VVLSSVYNFLYDSVVSWLSTSDSVEERALRFMYSNGYPINDIYPHVVSNKGLVLKGSKGPKFNDFVTREAEVLGSLKHKNIICFVAYDPKNHIIAFQHLEGKDIFDWIDSGTKLPVKPIFRQLLDVVSFIHSKGLVHGDVSVYNVQYDPKKNHITLFDFAGTRSEGKRQVSYPSFPLIAPEQSFDAHMQKANDVWGIAIIVHSIMIECGHPYTWTYEITIDESTHIWAMTQTTGETIPRDEKIEELNPKYSLKSAAVKKFRQLREQGAKHIKFKPLDKSTPEGELVAKMLRIFPGERITAAAALEAPYFTDS